MSPEVPDADEEVICPSCNRMSRPDVRLRNEGRNWEVYCGMCGFGLASDIEQDSFENEGFGMTD